MAASILIKKASDSDFAGIWEIFRRVVESGDTYAYSPDSSKEEAYDFWTPPNKYTYIAIVNNKIVGTYIIKQNRPGLGSHVANAAYMVHPEDHGHGIGYAMAIHS